MPTYKITDHETGKTLRISGDSPPTEQEAEKIFADAGYRDNNNPTAPAKNDSITDAIRSIPGGLAKGVNSMLGFPGDLETLVGRGTVDALNFITGGKKSYDDVAKNGVLRSPTSSDLNKAVSEPFGGYYEPKTLGGEYAQTIASFAPAALSPGGLVARASRVVVPAVTSETAGQLTKGTPYEPYARVAGALIGGFGQGLAEDRITKASTVRSAPTNSDLRTQANDLYKSADEAGVSIKSNAYDDLANDITSTIKSEGMHPKVHPKIQGVLEALDEAKGADVSLKNVDLLRRVASAAAKSNEADERRLASIIIGKIDDFTDNLSVKDIAERFNPDLGAGEMMPIGQQQVEAGKMLSDARSLWSRMRKSEIVDNAIERAKNTALAQNGNVAGGLRNEFKSLANNKKLMRGFSPEEQQAIRDVATAGLTRRAMIALGALRPRGLAGLMELGHGVQGIYTTGDMRAAIPAAVVAGTGLTAQSALNAVTRGDATLASALMRSGQAPTAAITGANPSRAAILSTILSRPQPMR